MDARDLAAAKALTERTRLRILGRLAAGSATVEELGRELQLSRSALDRHLGVLRRADLVRTEGPKESHRLALDPVRLNAIGRALDTLESADQPGPPMTGPDGAPLPADDARVIRAFFEGDRLREIPAQEKKRLVVLRYLRDRSFVEDRAYPEKEVNQRLGLFHRDVASLRRYMVDAGLMTRAAGEYRRA